MSEGPVEYDERAVDRLALFSDAVAAIAITLLAIDLPVPAGNTVSAFWASVQRNDGHYAAFLLSFTAIATMWSNHHNIFRYLKRADGRLRAINRGPETTDTQSLQSGFYALIQVLESAAVLAMLQHISSHRGRP